MWREHLWQQDVGQIKMNCGVCAFLVMKERANSVWLIGQFLMEVNGSEEEDFQTAEG